MDKIKKVVIGLLIFIMTFGTINPQLITIAFAEDLQQKCVEGVLSEDGTHCEDVPKEEPPLECVEGVLSKDGTYCEDVPKEEPPLECIEGVLSEDGTHCEDVPKEEPPLMCIEGVLSEDGTYCEDVPKEEPPLECVEGVLSEDGTYCEGVSKEEPGENNNGTGNGEVISPPVESEKVPEETSTDTEASENPSGETNIELLNLNLPEGLKLKKFSSDEIVIDLKSDSNSNNTQIPQQFTIPSEVLQQLSELMNKQQSDGRQTLIFRIDGGSSASLNIPTDALINMKQLNPNLFIKFLTGMGSSGFPLRSINEQQLRGASSIGMELTSVSLPQQQGSTNNISNAVRFTNFIVDTNGRRVIIDPIAMNFFSENSLNIQRQFEQHIVFRYDEILKRWVPVPNWNQNKGTNEIIFTGVYSGIYAPIPPRQLTFNDTEGLSPGTRQLISSGIVNGNANGTLNLNQELTMNQGVTLITRTLGLEAGDPTTGLPNTSVAGGSIRLANQIGLLNNVSGGLQANNPLPTRDFVQMMNNGLEFSANQNGANLQNNNNNTLITGGSNPSSTASLQVNNTLGNGVLNMNNLNSMDIETALMAVQSNRANLLDNQLKDQIESVQQRNQQTSELNDALNNARTIEIKLNLDKMTPQDYAQLEKLLQQHNISIEGTSSDAYKTALEKFMADTKIQIDAINNSQQMDMLRLQSLTNKRNEAFDLMTNFVKKMQDNRSSIIGNMR